MHTFMCEHPFTCVCIYEKIRCGVNSLVSRVGYILLNHWPKRSDRTPQNIKGYYPCFFIMLHSLLYGWRHSLIISPNVENLTSCSKALAFLTSDHGLGRYFAHLTEGKINTRFTQLQNMWPTTQISCKIDWYDSGTNVMGITSHI